MKYRTIDNDQDYLTPTFSPKIKEPASEGRSATAPRPEFRSSRERLAAGRTLRETFPRSSQAAWKPPAERCDRVAVLEESNRDRLPQMVPIRYEGILRRPFTFPRGSAELVAYDPASTPTTKIKGFSL